MVVVVLHLLGGKSGTGSGDWVGTYGEVGTLARGGNGGYHGSGGEGGYYGGGGSANGVATLCGGGGNYI